MNINQNKSDQKGFKLLAIRPLKGCALEYLKVLEEGQIYAFYNEYSFNRENKDDIHSEINSIDFQQEIPSNLFTDESLSINISAIVGKNGSGKSSLIEFLYYTIYVLGNNVALEANGENPILRTYPDMLVSDIKWKFKQMKKAKCIVDRVRKINTLLRQLPEEKNKHTKIINEFKGSIFYNLNGLYYELKIDESVKISILNLDKKKSDAILDLKIIQILQKTHLYNPEILNHFFYTISINYSHYALNSNFIGKWINTLFHKNDGYRTPAVINPMRTDGNFDINKEMVFAKYRLLSNLLVEKLKQKDKKNEVYITDQQYVKAVRFTYNKNKVKENSIRDTGVQLSSIKGRNREVMLLSDLYDHFFEGYTYLDLKMSPSPFLDEIGNYIIQKIDQIIETYDIFSEGYEYDISLDNQSERLKFVQRLIDNPSHIVFKLKQALNFLLQNISYSSTPSLPWNKYFDINSEHVYEFSISDLLDWMSISEVPEILSHLPPAIFDIDFILSNTSGSISKFSDLSSGEQQMIHSTQSAIYHINNLESIHTSNDHTTRYENINIIYDEIELYFHPEYQREFISRLRKSLLKLDLGNTERGVKSVNILFSTHSPFILSDIPSQNILKLDVNKDGKSEPQPMKEQTFGANIHNLLANDFFLKDGFMGSLAKEKIEEIMYHLKPENLLNDTEQIKRMKEIIELVGEPIIRSRLKQLFKLHYPAFSDENDDIEERIRKQQELLRQLKNQRKKGNA